MKQDTRDPIVLASLAIVVLAAFGTALVYARLPNEMPIHFDIHGNVDGHAPRWIGAWLLPLVTASLAAIMLAVSRARPIGERSAMRAVAFLTCALLGAFQLLVLRAALESRVQMGSSMAVIFGIFFVACGLVMPKLRRNAWAGIRVPWTLSSDEAWARSHRIGGMLFVIGGVLALVFAAVDAPSAAIASAVAAALATIPASWWVTRPAA